ncbi:hypothetical protein EVAR_100527_1 [Eumeta japonica]|uniref:Uncharacterized protein n=1 Tax=Eumeta variegata TaxID=151549 RepID=A0A4C2A778_EUMVA|nr:hypothetical protein EVAR_100527_1 [Eumeta japonica]
MGTAAKAKRRGGVGKGLFDSLISLLDLVPGTVSNVPVVVRHHVSIPVTLVPLFHGSNILMELFPLFLTQINKLPPPRRRSPDGGASGGGERANGGEAGANPWLGSSGRRLRANRRNDSGPCSGPRRGWHVRHPAFVLGLANEGSRSIQNWITSKIQAREKQENEYRVKHREETRADARVHKLR